MVNHKWDSLYIYNEQYGKPQMGFPTCWAIRLVEEAPSIKNCRSMGQQAGHREKRMLYQTTLVPSPAGIASHRSCATRHSE